MSPLLLDGTIGSQEAQGDVDQRLEVAAVALWRSQCEVEMPVLRARKLSARGIGVSYSSIGTPQHSPLAKVHTSAVHLWPHSKMMPELRPQIPEFPLHEAIQLDFSYHGGARFPIGIHDTLAFARLLHLSEDAVLRPHVLFV